MKSEQQKKSTLNWTLILLGGVGVVLPLVDWVYNGANNETEVFAIAITCGACLVAGGLGVYELDKVKKE